MDETASGSSLSLNVGERCVSPGDRTYPRTGEDLVYQYAEKDERKVTEGLR